MKYVITVLSCFIFIQLFACCTKSNKMTSSPTTTINTDSMKLKITIGTNTFTATLYNNATVTAFKKSLLLTLNMHELNSNEKYFDLPNNLPANASNPGTIRAGDLMLYGSNTLVLFYKTFTTSYSYTPMAHIDDAAGLTAALGASDVTVTFALQ
jgi:hypothetical protein